MATKQESPNESIQNADKKMFFKNMQIKHRELAKRQREYKEILGKRYRTRSERIIEKSLLKAIDALQVERNDLRAEIWVADNPRRMRENNRYLKEIKCHVDCQEHLAEEINALKVAIRNMEQEKSRVDREVYDLNRQTVPESQHQQYVQRMRTSLGILRNQLEVSLRRECIFSAENRKLRIDVKNILYERAQFNGIYLKLVNSLNSDKKYMADLVEYAVNMYDNCIDVSEKIDLKQRKINKEREQRKAEALALIRTNAANEVVDDFIGAKSKTRTLAPLQPKEQRRQAEYKASHERKIRLYNREIEKLIDITKAPTIYDVIERYQQQESVYHSFFRIDNEREYHITLLNNAVSRLYDEVERLKKGNVQRIYVQVSELTKLEEELEQKQRSGQELDSELVNDTNRLKKYLAELQEIMVLARLSNEPLLKLLGDHTRVNLVNMRRFTKLFEERLNDFVKHFYLTQRADGTIPINKYVIKGIDKLHEVPTPLGDIVLAQHCPECAEGEAFTVDDAGDGCRPLSKDEAMKSLFEKVNQPEMQYRLHSISQCRLPRSRYLAAKRYT